MHKLFTKIPAIFILEDKFDIQYILFKSSDSYFELMTDGCIGNFLSYAVK